MSVGTTLYYPYIHPRSLGNIKSALLYWDRVRRIVPQSVRVGDHVRGDDRDTRALADRGLLVATDPELYQTKAADRFFAEVAIETDRFRIQPDAARAIVDDARGIHIEKIAEPVIRRLRKERLAHQFGDWIGMREEIGAFYMYCLASEMGSRIDAPLFAEAEDDAAVGQALLFQPDTSGDVSSTLAALEVDVPSAEQLREVSVEALANFVESRAGERRRFRLAMESIIEKVRATADPNAIEDYLSDQRTEIREATNASRAVLDELHAGAAGGFMKITVPAGFAAAIAAASIQPISAAILAGTGIVMSVISLWAETRGKLRAAKRTSPYHYLALIRRELQPNPPRPQSRATKSEKEHMRSKRA
jgi:hypothetical protein